MMSQSSSQTNDEPAIHVTIDVTVVIPQRWNRALGSDDATPTDDARAEARTRQQHATTDSADTSAADR